MQAYGEGFDLLHSARQSGTPEHRYAFALDDVAEVWRRGSVIGSWLLDLTSTALAEDPLLTGYAGRVADSGEGRWTVEAAVENGVPAAALSLALYARFRSRQSHTFAEKVLSAMRQGFGGHAEPAAPAEPPA
jgi:6-phosphogluconate dehydrogenase